MQGLHIPLKAVSQNWPQMLTSPIFENSISRLSKPRCCTHNPTASFKSHGINYSSKYLLLVVLESTLTRPKHIRKASMPLSQLPLARKQREAAGCFATAAGEAAPCSGSHKGNSAGGLPDSGQSLVPWRSCHLTSYGFVTLEGNNPPRAAVSVHGFGSWQPTLLRGTGGLVLSWVLRLK